MRIRIIDEVEEGRSERKFYEELFLYKEVSFTPLITIAKILTLLKESERASKMYC